MIKLTSRMLHEVATTGYSGWNKKQLAALGVGWPAPRGWLKELVGKEISESQWAKVVELKGANRNPEKMTFRQYIKSLEDRIAALEAKVNR